MIWHWDRFLVYVIQFFPVSIIPPVLHSVFFILTLTQRQAKKPGNLEIKKCSSRNWKHWEEKCFHIFSLQRVNNSNRRHLNLSHIT